MCGNFWECASEEYRRGVQNGLLYPPRNQHATVNSYSIYVMLDLEDVLDPRLTADFLCTFTIHHLGELPVREAKQMLKILKGSRFFLLKV